VYTAMTSLLYHKYPFKAVMNAARDSVPVTIMDCEPGRTLKMAKRDLILGDIDYALDDDDQFECRSGK
ncbi:hypothetical protein KIPB_016540, partial [Kipferlia bialata]